MAVRRRLPRQSDTDPIRDLESRDYLKSDEFILSTQRPATMAHSQPDPRRIVVLISGSGTANLLTN